MKNPTSKLSRAILMATAISLLAPMARADELAAPVETAQTQSNPQLGNPVMWIGEKLLEEALHEGISALFGGLIGGEGFPEGKEMLAKLDEVIERTKELKVRIWD